MDDPKPSLLFLGQALPYPLDSGVAIRTFQAFRMLADRFDVDALFFYRRAHTACGPSIEARTERLREFGEVEAFPIPQEESAGRFALDHARSMATGRPYTYYAYDSRRYAAAIEELTAKKRYDVIHLDSLDLVRYADRFDPERVACTHHNVESDLLRRRAARDRSAMRRLGMTLQVNRVAAAEAEWCPRFALNIAVSAEDARALREVAPGARVEVIPNGIEAPSDTLESGEGSSVLFVGGTSWFPNRDALEFFATEVVPALGPAASTTPLVWVGRCSGDERARMARRGIDMAGYVEDLVPYYEDAACVVAPLRVGGGTRLKILGAWGSGKAVVSTTIGCEGLDARDGENILIADGPRDFAKAIDRLIDDPELRMRLGRRARETLEERFSWKAIAPRFTALYEAMLPPGANGTDAGRRPLRYRDGARA
jgi:glycosyltransferase involved in cell wall biosynthesis